MPNYYSRLRRVSAICIGVVFCLASASVMMRPAPAASAALAGCPMFPADNVWNARVDGLPVDVRSSEYITAIGANNGLHPDFGAGWWDGYPIGMFYTSVTSAQVRVPINYTEIGRASCRERV